MSAPRRSPTAQRLLGRFAALGRVFLPLMGSEQSVLLLTGSVVGVLLAFGALAFGALVDAISRLCFGSPDGRFSFAPHEEVLEPLLHQPWWWIVLAPALGGLLVGPLVHRFAREAKGHGIPEVMEAVALRAGRIRKRVATVKILASALTIGTGGSAGREGPVVQIGSSLASGLGQMFGFPAHRTKTIVACGAAAGIAATFNAPIAGVVFALEIITGSFGIASFTPVVAAAVMATVVTHYIRGNVVVFEMPEGLKDATALNSPLEVVPYAVLGLVAGLVSVAYIRTLYFTEDRFDGLRRVPPALRAALGGLLVGLLGLLLPRILGQGYETILGTLRGESLPLPSHLADPGSALPPELWAALCLLLLVVAKIVATSLTIGSGGSGGVFAPSLYIGACLGCAFGLGVNTLFPTGTSIPSGYALVGMGALVAGVTHAPISAVLILFEMTDDYDVILPLMLATVISTAVCAHLQGDSIYTLKLRRKGVRLHEGREQAVLGRLKVADAMTTAVVTIPETTPFRQVVRMVTGSSGHTFPVVDPAGKVTGLLDFDDVRGSLTIEEIGDLVIAKEVASTVEDHLCPDDNLERAFEVFEASGLNELPVLKSGDPTHLEGMLSRQAAMDVYQRELAAWAQAAGT